jgi:hypothetical protein
MQLRRLWSVHAARERMNQLMISNREPVLSSLYNSYLLWIQSHNLNFNTHIVFSEPCNPNTSPDRLMIRHPLLEVPCHSSKCLVVDWDVVRVDPKDLRPALSASIFEIVIDVFERLVNLRVDLK